MIVVAAVIAYLVGAVPIGLLVARLTGGVDIRGHGSGNIGASNVHRTLGVRAGIVTLAGDVLKGAVATVAAGLVAGGDAGAAVGAVAAVGGNCWPVYLRFRGGKGVATGLGAFLAATPLAVAPAAVVFALLLVTRRYVSLASLAGCATLPVAAAWLGHAPLRVGAALVTAVVIVWRHRANIARLRAGTEPRLGEKATVGPTMAGPAASR